MSEAWLIHGLWAFVGFVAGFFVAALMAASGDASRWEERQTWGMAPDAEPEPAHDAELEAANEKAEFYYRMATGKD